MTTFQGILLALGALLEFGGIVALAVPDFLPHGRRLSYWLAQRRRRFGNAIRRLLRRPPRPHYVNVSSSLSVAGSMRASGLKGAPDATLEEQVAWLLKRDQQAQRDVNALSERVLDLEEGTPKKLEQLHGDMEAHVAQALAGALSEYRELRLLGAAALAVGLVCTTGANFV